MKSYLQISLHLLFWILFYLVVYSLVHKAFPVKITLWITLIGAFYLHTCYLVPRYLKKNSWLSYIGYTFVILLALSLVEIISDYLFNLEPIASGKRSIAEYSIFVLSFAFFKTIIALPLSFLYLFVHDLIFLKKVTVFAEVSVHILIIGILYFLLMTMPPHWSPEVSSLHFLFKAIYTFAFLGLQLCFFYLNAFVFIPRLIVPRKYGLYLMSLLSLFAFSFAIEYALYGLPPFSANQSEHLTAGMKEDILIKTGLLIISFLYKFTKDWFHHEHIRQELILAKVIAEGELLKFQVHPHFLFNTLNNIHSLALIENSPRTVKSLGKLGRMMRYMLEEGGQEKVELEKELDYLRCFVELQQLRLAEGIEVNFQVKGQPQGFLIAPMLLIPFVENAYKHGISFQAQSFISIHIEIEKSELYLVVRK